MRGAAGNLALNTLYTMAATLEGAARSRAMWPWQTVSCAICRRRGAPGRPAGAAGHRGRTRGRCKPLPTCRPAQLQYWLDETIAALQGGELASDALDALQACVVPRHPAAAGSRGRV
jgi:hypothetical protein